MLPLPDAVLAILCGLSPLALEDFDAEAGMEWIAAGKVAIRKTAVGLVLAAPGYEFEVAHDWRGRLGERGGVE